MPAIENRNATIPIIAEEMSIGSFKRAIVIPTANASMLVAIARRVTSFKEK